MYKNLLAEMARVGMTKKELAKKIGLSEASITNKMSGFREWKISEVKAITKLFPDVDFNYLFEVSDECGD